MTNVFDAYLSRHAAALGNRNPLLIIASVGASLGADEDVGLPLYATAGLVGTIFSWSLVRNILGIDSVWGSGFRDIGNVGLDMIMLWVLTCAIESSLKLIFRRPRPTLRTKASLPGDIFSFPSGHTMRGFYYYVPYLFTSRYVEKALGASPPIGFLPLALLAALLTGFSRIARLRHWPTDVLAGGLIGCLLGFYFERCVSQQTRLYVFGMGMLWAMFVTVAQYSPVARREFCTTKPSTEWTLFVFLAAMCFWLYTDDSVQIFH